MRAPGYAQPSSDKDGIDLQDQVRKLQYDNSKLGKPVIRGEACASARDETKNDLRSALEASQLEGWEIKGKFETLQHQMFLVEKENGELKKRLLKLQPKDIMSDAQINDKYKNLCADIEDWVDTNLGDTNDVVDCLDSDVEEEDYARSIMIFMDAGLWKSLQGHKSAQSWFLTCVVQRFIMVRILGRYASCIPRELTKSLRIIEEQMWSSDKGKQVCFCPSTD